MDATIRQRAIELVEKAGDAVLTSIDGEGYPRAVPMAKVKAEGMETIWFSTSTSSRKVKHFAANPKAGVCFFEPGKTVSLVGEIEVVEDMELKKALWIDWFIEHFPGGVTDPEYCLMKFTAKRASLWLGDVFDDFDL